MFVLTFVATLDQWFFHDSMLLIFCMVMKILINKVNKNPCKSARQKKSVVFMVNICFSLWYTNIYYDQVS